MGKTLCAKLFMKDPLDKVQYAPKRFRAFIDLVRPFTLLAPALGGITGSLMALLVQGDLSKPFLSGEWPFLHVPGLPLMTMFSGVTSLVFLNAASNTLNQVYDRDIDVINKAYRPIPMKVVSPLEGIWIAVALYGIALWRAAMVNRYFLLIVAVLILFTISYSVPPFRFKKRLWLSNISVAIPRGMLGIVAAWSITGDIMDPTPWVIGSVMVVFLIGSTTTKDITDIPGDVMFGMKTLPVYYGKKKAIILSSPFLIIPFVMMGLYWYLDLLPGYSLSMALVFLIWSILLIYLLYKEGDKEDEHFENSPAWKQMYLMLMGMQLGFLTLFLI
ncbi:MAG: UbiA prenyltransferase family protein [Candidatus Thermoplasmatota archaeon]|nr:UbiA prenyltransferase family protein [Candidatus Thermoplasmatota archaeon]